MPQSNILPFRDIGFDDLPLVGGKNASLGELIKLEGINVPDGFAITKDAPNPDNAREFVRIITRKEAQEAFNQNKGSICARTDCDYSTFPADRRAYFQSAADDFAVANIIPMVTHGSGAIPTWQGQFGQIVTQFSSDRNVAAAQAALVLAAEDAGFPQ